MTEQNEIHLDGKRLLIDHAPTRVSKLSLLALLLVIFGASSLLQFLNPLWPGLAPKELVILQSHTMSSLALIGSIFLNFYFVWKMHKLSKFVSKELPIMAKESAAYEIDAFKAKHNIP